MYLGGPLRIPCHRGMTTESQRFPHRKLFKIKIHVERCEVRKRYN